MRTNLKITLHLVIFCGLYICCEEDIISLIIYYLTCFLPIYEFKRTELEKTLLVTSTICTFLLLWKCHRNKKKRYSFNLARGCQQQAKAGSTQLSWGKRTDVNLGIHTWVVLYSKILTLLFLWINHR